MAGLYFARSLRGAEKCARVGVVMETVLPTYWNIMKSRRCIEDENAGYNNDFTGRGSKEISFAPQKMLASAVTSFETGYLIKLF